MLATGPTACTQVACGSKKQKTTGNDDKATVPGAHILYQDRNTRIQYVNDSQIEFSIDVPGTKASDTKVEIVDGELKVHAERKHDNGKTTKFERSFYIKDISDTDSGNIHANLEDGVLRITIPRKVEVEKNAAPQPITIMAKYPPVANDGESDKDFHFTLDLPGVSTNNVTLEVKGDTIALHATRKVLDKVTTIERSFTVDLDKVDVTTVKAYLVDGVMTLKGSKKEAAKPLQILVVGGLTKATSDTPMVTENATDKDLESKEDEDMVVVETVIAEE
jgi:HSP20 family protein